MEEFQEHDETTCCSNNGEIDIVHEKEEEDQILVVTAKRNDFASSSSSLSLEQEGKDDACDNGGVIHPTSSTHDHGTNASSHEIEMLKESDNTASTKHLLARTSTSLSTSTITTTASSISLESCAPPQKILNESQSIREYERQQKTKEAEEELTKRAQKRQMTSNQELWNSITMLPPPLYCLFVCFSGIWLTQSDIDNVSLSSSISSSSFTDHDFDDSSCIQSSWLPNFHAIPPMTVIAMLLAVVGHSPCSMYYHLLCAYKLPPGPERMDHWTRRLDQAMIHYMSSMFSYATSAKLNYFLITMVFNIDCMYRLFQKGMFRPKQTLYRMIGAFLMPMLPLVLRGEFGTVLLLIAIYSVSCWIFATYPFGGWSHGFFHLVIFLSNPIWMRAALKLDVVRDTVDYAAQCAFLLSTSGGGGVGGGNGFSSSEGGNGGDL